MLQNPPTVGALRLLLATTLAAPAATVDFTSNLDATYDRYRLAFQHVIPVTTSTLLQLRTSADAGATWASTAGDYEWVNFGESLNSATPAAIANASQTSTAIILSTNTAAGGSSNVTADGGLCGYLDLIMPAGTTIKKRIQAIVSDFSTVTGNNGLSAQHVAARRLAIAAINGVRLFFSSGNIAAGASFQLYGMAKS